MSNSLQSTPLHRTLAIPMLFASLEAELQEELLRASPVRSYSDGAIIQQRGDAPGGFWVIESGRVVVGQFMPDGAFRAVAVLGEGDSYGELAVFADTPRAVDSLARGVARLRFVRRETFLAALERHPASSRALLGALSLQLQEVLGLLAGIRQGGSTTRLALLLANMAGTQQGPADIAATQAELADLLGLTRATVNAGLRELEAQGLVERGYGRLRLPAPERLGVIALA